jgi:hypothetical protein
MRGCERDQGLQGQRLRELHLLDRRASLSILVLFGDLSELDGSMLLGARRVRYWYVGDLIVSASIAEDCRSSLTTVSRPTRYADCL